MLKVLRTGKFDRDLKRLQKRGYDLSKMNAVVTLLADEQPLPEKNRDHDLKQNYRGFRECHIEPDWLLIYQVNKGNLILILTRTGTHSDLFR
ncbi:MAG: type II toxin-antitoxin system YafQ family toxin [Clostridia bacterium]|nr:type II toxin-antitoxin system YafQ family toxin [Clostridia bacterium]